MTVNQELLKKLGRFLLRGLRNNWTGGLSAGVAWLVFLQAKRRLPLPRGLIRKQRASFRAVMMNAGGCNGHGRSLETNRLLARQHRPPG